MNQKPRLHVHIAGQSSDNQAISTHRRQWLYLLSRYSISKILFSVHIGIKPSEFWRYWSPPEVQPFHQHHQHWAIHHKQLPRSQHITWPTWLKGALVPFVSAKRHKCAFVLISIFHQCHYKKKMKARDEASSLVGLRRTVWVVLPNCKKGRSFVWTSLRLRVAIYTMSSAII